MEVRVRLRAANIILMVAPTLRGAINIYRYSSDFNQIINKSLNENSYEAPLFIILLWLLGDIVPVFAFLASMIFGFHNKKI